MRDNREHVKKWRGTEAGKRYMANAKLKNSTGWTLDQRDAALAAQDGKCAICTGALAPAYCDHCHTTKRTRALLCRACNLGLGYYEKQQHPAGLVLAPYDEYIARYA